MLRTLRFSLASSLKICQEKFQVFTELYNHIELQYTNIFHFSFKHKEQNL